MARIYALWRLERLEPWRALGEAQRWVLDTTNGEKTEYFEHLTMASRAALQFLLLGEGRIVCQGLVRNASIQAG